MPANAIAANQLGFQSLTQGIGGLGSIAFAASADALTRNYNYGSSAQVSLSEPLMPMVDASTSSGLSMGDIAGILGMSMAAKSGESAAGNMLGSPTQLMFPTMAIARNYWIN